MGNANYAVSNDKVPSLDKCKFILLETSSVVHFKIDDCKTHLIPSWVLYDYDNLCASVDYNYCPGIYFYYCDGFLHCLHVHKKTVGDERHQVLDWYRIDYQFSE